MRCLDNGEHLIGAVLTTDWNFAQYGFQMLSVQQRS